ncbi:MAG: uroporphyrinogen-III synthase [Pseudomonadota bacterium]
MRYMAADTLAVVTRPEGQAAGLMQGLTRLGLDPVHLPMLAIDPIDPLGPTDRQHVLDLDLYQHLIFISANAARVGLSVIDDFWPQYPVGQRCWAVGESTAQVLESVGLSVSRPSKDMSSEGLLALEGLQSVAGDRVLIVRGEGGRELLADSLAQRGAQVDALRCYRRSPVQHDASYWQQRLESNERAVLLASSGEGVELLSRLLQPHENTKLAGHTLFVPTDRVRALAQDLGWRDIQCAANASDAAMLSSVHDWRDA